VVVAIAAAAMLIFAFLVADAGVADAARSPDARASADIVLL
jgi:hypothetical protein